MPVFVERQERMCIQNYLHKVSLTSSLKLILTWRLWHVLSLYTQTQRGIIQAPLFSLILNLFILV